MKYLYYSYFRLDLDRHWVMLKNRKAMGKPTLQRIRKKSKNPKLEEVAGRGTRPDHVKIHRSENNIHANIKLPKLTTVSQLSIEMNPDSINLITQPALYHLQLWLEELQIDHDRAIATFDHKTKMLSIIAPIF